jgi:hypothetical protein
MDEQRRDGPADIRGTDPLTPSSRPPARSEGTGAGESNDPGRESDGPGRESNDPAFAGPPTADVGGGSRADDYVDLYISPREVFERRRDGRFGQPLIILIAASLLIYYIFLPAGEAIMQAELAEQMADNPEAAEAMERFSGTMRLVMGIFVPIGVAAMILIMGVVLKALAALLKIAITFKQALVVSTFAGFIALLGQVAASISVMFANRDGSIEIPRDMSFGVLRLLDTDALPAVAVPLLGVLDVFAIWTAVIWGIGLYVIGRSEKGEAVAAAVIALLLTAVPGVVGAMM